MIEIAIPGYGELRLRHLVLDYNGTLACDGRLVPGVTDHLMDLSESLGIHVLTADTFGKAASVFINLPCQLETLPLENQECGKLQYVRGLGSSQTVCIGNGRNDRLMLKEAALGIAVILQEGAATEAVLAADVVCTNIVSALDLLTHPLRLVATLRS
jgi:soluble P-type ATPase